MFRQRTRRSDCKAGGCAVLLKELCSISVLRRTNRRTRSWSGLSEVRARRKNEFPQEGDRRGHRRIRVSVDFRSTIFPSRKRRKLWVWTSKRTLPETLWYPRHWAREHQEETIWSTRTCQGLFPGCRTMFQGVTRQTQKSKSECMVLPIDVVSGSVFCRLGRREQSARRRWRLEMKLGERKRIRKEREERERERDGKQHEGSKRGQWLCTDGWGSRR